MLLWNSTSHHVHSVFSTTLSFYVLLQFFGTEHLLHATSKQNSTLWHFETESDCCLQSDDLCFCLMTWGSTSDKYQGTNWQKPAPSLVLYFYFHYDYDDYYHYHDYYYSELLGWTNPDRTRNWKERCRPGDRADLVRKMKGGPLPVSRWMGKRASLCRVTKVWVEFG